MRLDDAYRLLDLSPGASHDDVKRAWRDLTKVWHPDRFAHDAGLRCRAEEKVKTLNEAFETIRAASAGAAGASRQEGAADRGAWGVGPPGTPAVTARARARANRVRAFLAAAAGLFLLLRRPTPAGLVVALALLGLTLFFVLRMRAAARDAETGALPGPGS